MPALDLQHSCSLPRLKLETYPPESCPLCQAGLPLEKPGSRPRS